MVFAWLPWVLGGACDCEESADPQRVRPVFCYRQLERSGPGRLHLSEPVDCTTGGRRWRAQGPRPRPDTVALLGPDDRVRMRYRIGYGSGGRVRWEERTFFERPHSIAVYELGQRYDFGTRGDGPWRPVRIRTTLDAQGRPVEVVKRVGGGLAYRLERNYGPHGLRAETTYGPDGELRLRTRYERRPDGGWIERMVDGRGELLLERPVEQPGAFQSPEELDTLRPGRVQPRPVPDK